MKILFTHELFPPDMAGGGEKLVLHLTQHLTKKGHSVKVLTSGDPKIKSYGGVETVRIPVNRYLMNILALPTILRHARDADIIQTSSGNMALPSYIVAKLLNKPICCWVHHIFGKYWRDVRGPVIGRIFEVVERLALARNFDYYVFENTSSKKIGAELGIPAKKMKMIAPGIDYKKFAPKRKIKRTDSVLFVGNFSMDEPTIKTKGVKYLMEAAEMLPNVQFNIVGNFKKKIRQPKNVTMLGVVKQKKLIELYKSAGAFVCSSLNEGFGLVLLEAMATGCAIVSTINIGQVGKKVKPKDSKAIADAIEFYINNPAKARADGNKNRKLAQRYTWNKFYDNFEKLHKNLNKRLNKWY